MRKTAKLAPPEGWSSFAKNREFLDFAMALDVDHHWPRVSFSPDTVFYESPDSEAGLYLKIQNGRVADAVAYLPDGKDQHFEAMFFQLTSTFALQETKSRG